MTKQQMKEWQEESVRQAYARIFDELKTIVRAAGEVH